MANTSKDFVMRDVEPKAVNSQTSMYDDHDEEEIQVVQPQRMTTDTSKRSPKPSTKQRGFVAACGTKLSSSSSSQSKETDLVNAIT